MPSPKDSQKLAELQAALGMLSADYTEKQLYEDGTPMYLGAIERVMPEFKTLKEWFLKGGCTITEGKDGDFLKILKKIKNDAINRLGKDEFLDRTPDQIANDEEQHLDRYLSLALALSTFMIFEPARSDCGLKPFDMSTRTPAGPSNQPVLAQGDLFEFDSDAGIAPKCLSVCQENRGVDYKVPVQNLNMLAAELGLYILVHASLVGGTNVGVFGPDPYTFACGDETKNRVLLLWMTHDSDKIINLPNGEDVNERAIYYGNNNSTEAAKAAFGTVMLQLTHAAVVNLW